jgi:LPS-assembly protein
VTGSAWTHAARGALALHPTAAAVVPSVKLRHTHPLHTAGDQDSPRAALPIASVDSKLFFDRSFTWRDRHLLQTLEPRLFYLYVPFRDQTDIPIFDTVRPEAHLCQLFQDNRFSERPCQMPTR